jgi:hypothetical protein
MGVFADQRAVAVVLSPLWWGDCEKAVLTIAANPKRPDIDSIFLLLIQMTTHWAMRACNIPHEISDPHRKD